MLAIRRITGFHGVLCWFDMKYLQFLAHIFLDYKMSFRCFDWLSALSAKDGCYTRFIRGTKNFETYCVLPGNRCKFTSMFRLHLAGTSCASIAGCRMKFQVPLTAFLMHPHISEPCRYAVKHWKDRLNSKRKQSSLVLQHSVLKNNRKPGYPIQ